MEVHSHEQILRKSLIGIVGRTNRDCAVCVRSEYPQYVAAVVAGNQRGELFLVGVNSINAEIDADSMITVQEEPATAPKIAARSDKSRRRRQPSPTPAPTPQAEATTLFGAVLAKAELEQEITAMCTNNAIENEEVFVFVANAINCVRVFNTKLDELQRIQYEKVTQPITKLAFVGSELHLLTEQSYHVLHLSKTLDDAQDVAFVYGGLAKFMDLAIVHGNSNNAPVAGESPAVAVIACQDNCLRVYRNSDLVGQILCQSQPRRVVPYPRELVNKLNVDRRSDFSKQFVVVYGTVDGQVVLVKFTTPSATAAAADTPEEVWRLANPPKQTAAIDCLLFADVDADGSEELVVVFDDGTIHIHSFGQTARRLAEESINDEGALSFFDAQPTQKQEKTKTQPVLIAKSSFREPIRSLGSLAIPAAPRSASMSDPTVPNRRRPPTKLEEPVQKPLLPMEFGLMACSQSGIIIRLTQSSTEAAFSPPQNLQFEQHALQALQAEIEQLTQQLLQRKQAHMHLSSPQQQLQLPSKSQKQPGKAENDSSLLDLVMGIDGGGGKAARGEDGELAGSTAQREQRLITTLEAERNLAERIRLEERLTFIAEQCEYELALDSLLYIDTVIVCADFCVQILDTPKNFGVLSVSATWPMEQRNLSNISTGPSVAVSSTILKKSPQPSQLSIGAALSSSNIGSETPNKIKTAVTIRCSSSMSKVRIRLRTQEGCYGSLWVTTICLDSARTQSAALTESLSITTRHSIPLLNLHHTNVLAGEPAAGEGASAQLQQKREFSRMKYTGGFSRSIINSWLDVILPRAVRNQTSSGDNQQAVVVSTQSTLVGTWLRFAYSDGSAELECENPLTLRLFNDCLLKLAQAEGIKVSMTMDFNVNSIAATLRIFERSALVDVRRAAVRMSLAPVVQELIASTPSSTSDTDGKTDDANSWLIPDLDVLAKESDNYTQLAMNDGDKIARFIVEAQRVLIASARLRNAKKLSSADMEQFSNMLLTTPIDKFLSGFLQQQQQVAMQHDDETAFG